MYTSLMITTFATSISRFKEVVERAHQAASESSAWNLKLVTEHLRAAVALEFFTIPPYLTALYSIHGESNAAQMAQNTIRTVVVEEMLHMELACNLLNAIGVVPDVPRAHPVYPMSPPYICNFPPVKLAGATREQIEVFTQIEHPAPPPDLDDLEPKDCYDSIGHFYDALMFGLVIVELQRLSSKKGSIFDRSRGIDRTAFANRFEQIYDLETALRAMEAIVVEGEGFRQSDFVPPALGMESEPEKSHYERFKELLDPYTLGDDIYPLDPGKERLNPRYRNLSRYFDACYSLVVQQLQASFTLQTPDNGDMRSAISTMLGNVQVVAEYMMSLPLPQQDINLCPEWRFIPRVTTEVDLFYYFQSLNPTDRKALRNDYIGNFAPEPTRPSGQPH